MQDRTGMRVNYVCVVVGERIGGGRKSPVEKIETERVRDSVRVKGEPK